MVYQDRSKISDKAMSCLMNPRREKGEPLLSGTVLFYINPAEAGRVFKLASQMGGRRYYMYNSNLWKIELPKEPFYLCGPAVGAPMAVLVLEKLIALGAERIIICGTCGSLQTDLAIGDILLPDQALSAEGVSKHYPLDTPPVVSGKLLTIAETFLQKSSLAWQLGAVCSTDAPYRETISEIKEYQQRGVYAMDMEFSALLTVATFRQVDIAAIMVVSDQLCDNSWQPGFKNSRFKQRMRAVSEGLISFMGAN